MIVLSGKVIKGEGFGRALGFPTANLDRREYCRKNLKIRFGVYAGTAFVKTGLVRGAHRAGIVIGPLDKTGLPKLEAYLLGFQGNLYGKRIVLELKKYLRPFKKFDDIKSLKEQIKKDVAKIRKAKL